MFAAGIAGCGGRSSTASSASLSNFKSTFISDREQFRQLGRELGHAIVTARLHSNAQLATEFNAFAERANQQATRVANLNPPAKFQATVNQLRTDFKAVAADLKRIAAAARQGDAQAARAATRKLLHDASHVKAADIAVSDALNISMRS